MGRLLPLGSLSPMIALLRGAVQPPAATMGLSKAAQQRPTLLQVMYGARVVGRHEAFSTDGSPSYKPRRRRTRREAVRPIYIKNLPPEVDRERLRKEFAEYGEIKELRLPPMLGSSLNRGHGYVTFTEEEATIRALEHANGKEIHGQSIQVEPRQPRKIREPPPLSSLMPSGSFPPKTDTPSRTLWFKLREQRGSEDKIDRNAAAGALRKACSSFGKVEGVVFGFAQGDRQRLVAASVKFDLVKSATEAQQSLMWAEMDGRPSFVRFEPGSAGPHSNGGARGWPGHKKPKTKWWLGRRG